MSADATDPQLEYLEALRVQLATYSVEAYREANEIWDGADPLTVAEASEAIDAFLDAIDEAREKRRKL